MAHLSILLWNVTSNISLGILIKYADDTNLLVPEHTDQLDEEFGHIENCALKNKMIINKAKTKELVFHRPHPTKFDMPDSLDGIAQERPAKFLGVIFTGKLIMLILC